MLAEVGRFVTSRYRRVSASTNCMPSGTRSPLQRSGPWSNAPSRWIGSRKRIGTSSGGGERGNVVLFVPWFTLLGFEVLLTSWVGFDYRMHPWTVRTLVNANLVIAGLALTSSEPERPQSPERDTP